MNTSDEAVIKRKVAEYALAEDKGASLLKQMLEFTPGEEEQQFIQKQLADELKHSQMFQEEAMRLNAEEEFFLSSLDRLYVIGQKCVTEQDWIKCMVCQSIIEEIALASFSSFYPRVDDQIKGILKEIIEDEKEHLDFTIEQIGKWVTSEEDKKKVAELQAEILEIFVAVLTDGKLKQEVPSEEERKQFIDVMKKTYVFHKNRFESVGIALPKIPKKHLLKIGIFSL